MRRPAVGVALLFLVAANTAQGQASSRTATAGESEAGRFFFQSDSGRLELHEPAGKQPLRVRYRDPSGRYDPDALRRIRHAFRSHGDQREGDIALRLIELLAYVQEEFGVRATTLISGYRSPQHNEGIRAAGARAAKSSLHTEGLAADVKLRGVDLRRLWLDLRERKTGGVGYYRSGAFLHLDVGPPRFWEEGTSRVSEDLSAGNARVFARTDFDRYADLRGARIGLHGVTAFPLRLATRGRGAQAEDELRLAPGPGTRLVDDCIEIAEPGERYVVEVVSGPARADGPLHLSTCEPRIDRTPLEIESNRVVVAPTRARRNLEIDTPETYEGPP